MITDDEDDDLSIHFLALPYIYRVKELVLYGNFGPHEAVAKLFESIQQLPRLGNLTLAIENDNLDVVMPLVLQHLPGFAHIEWAITCATSKPAH